MSISYIFILFLTQMSVGMIATVSFLPSDIIDNRFFRSITFWATLFTGTALAFQHWAHFSLPQVFDSSGASLASRWMSISHVLFYIFGILCLFLWFRIQWRDIIVSQKELIFIALVGLAALTFNSLPFRPELPPMWAQNILLPLNFISTSLILGGFLAGMIFGHYYLVNTEMPKRLLVTMAWLLIGVMIFRICAVGITLALYKGVVRPDTNFLSVLTSFQGHGIFFWERALVGLFIPSIVVAMIWSTARIGSNQSATGIMYVAIAFIFIGELVARYLFLLSAIPL